MTADHQKLMALDAAAGAEDAHSEDLWEGARGYLIGLILSVLLTALAFFFTGSDWLWEPSIPVALSVLAIAQIGVHLAFFLHLTTAPDSVNNSLALAFGTLIVALVIGGTLWIMYHMNLNMPPMTQMAVPAVTTSAGSRAATGVIEAASPTPVTAKVEGVVRSIDCDVGAQVHQGQLCARIDAPPFEQAVAQGESALRAAQARVTQDKAALAAAQARPDRRPAAIRRVGALQDALGRDERSAAAALQALGAAKARLDDAKILAPTDGVVLARNVEPGQAVAANTQPPLFLIAPGAAVAFKASLPDSLAALRPGDRVVFTVDALRGERFEGEILLLTPAQGGESAQAVVGAKNPGATLKPGMKATIRAPAE
jgi:cytochrome o ubiquinol oxidase subunit IV